MAPVEWTRLEGGQVEAVVAMFVNRERPESVRITPSKGDGGVDILDRGAGPDGTDVVYQVKRYTDKLTAKQKGDIKDSLDRLMSDDRWKGLSVREWRLVTPWDPSPEAEDWLQGLGYPDVRKIWHGLAWADQQAAKYDDVVDYYLHGGRALVETAHAQIISLVGVQKMPDGLAVRDVQRRVQEALQVLDHDPHYRYEHRFGEGDPPPYPRHGERPGLVMHSQLVEPGGGRWSTVDIIARCAASVQERPITVKGAFTAEPGSEFAEQLEAWFTYGAPFTSPEGAFAGELDAPGGIGGPLGGGTLWIGPTEEHDLGQNPDLHLEVLDPAGVPLAEVDVRRVERTEGLRGGLRVVLEEIHGVFTTEDRVNLPDRRLNRTVRFGDWSGKPVATVYASLHFLSLFHRPNKIRVSVRHTPAARGVVDSDGVFDPDHDIFEWLQAILRMLEPLTRLQEHTSTPILTPDLEEVTHKEVAGWQRVAAILAGEEITGTYPEGHALMVVLGSEVTFDESQPARILLPLTAKVGEQSIDLAHCEAVLDSPKVLDRRSEGGQVTHALTTPDRTIRWRRHDPTDVEEAGSDV